MEQCQLVCSPAGASFSVIVGSEGLAVGRALMLGSWTTRMMATSHLL